MKHNSHSIRFISLVALTLLLSTGDGVNAQEAVAAQERPAFAKEDVERAKSAQPLAAAAVPAQPACRGPITRVLDVGDESVRFTSANYFASPGGGEGGRFDKTPLLTTRVQLTTGCLNAHLSGIVGSRQTYGVASRSMFQVTLTRLSPPVGGPRHMFGHFETPFGLPSPAVALEAERDVDMLGANFFQRIGPGPHAVPPGIYRVDVWWSGAGPGGAIGAAFVLKLYQR
jgi:hypothetical protein